jgi:hypothetical protein
VIIGMFYLYSVCVLLLWDSVGAEGWKDEDSSQPPQPPHSLRVMLTRADHRHFVMILTTPKSIRFPQITA